MKKRVHMNVITSIFHQANQFNKPSNKYLRAYPKKDTKNILHRCRKSGEPYTKQIFHMPKYFMKNTRIVC